MFGIKNNSEDSHRSSLLRLANISRKEVFYRNTLLTKDSQFIISCDDNEIKLTLQSGVIFPRAEDLLEIRLLIDGSECVVFASLDQIYPWLPAPCNEITNEIPNELVHALFELCLKKIETFSEQFNIKSFKLLNITKKISTSIRNNPPKCLLVLLEKNENSNIELFIEEGSYTSKYIYNLPSKEFYNSSNLLLNIHFSVGATKLSLDDILEAKNGDIILLEQYFWHSKQSHVYIENLLYGIAAEQNKKFTLTNQELWMKSSQDESISSAFSKIELEVRFDLGKIKMPLSEILSLDNGFVFDLNRDEFAPVDMVVNGVKVADCQLISISGKVGAKIIKADTSILNAKVNRIEEQEFQDKSFDVPELDESDY